MPSGGKRKPDPRTPPGGPGQYSRRTDGQQVATPGLSGDLQYGDVGRMEAAQRSMPLPSGTPTPQPQRPVGERRQTGAGPSGRSGGIPKHLLEMDPSMMEPTTTGLDIGDGAGSEVLHASTPAPSVQEQTLEYLYVRYHNNDAFEMLNKLRGERAAQAQGDAGVTPTAMLGAGTPSQTEATPPPAELS